MPLFKIDKKNLKQITEESFDLEKDIQKITEDNLEKVFGHRFVSTEFRLNNLRIDTLAFDVETKSFVIIEYKKDRSLSVIDQGYAYLALLLNNKADFILEYNEKMNKSLRRDDVDWSQSRVIFISPQFSAYQKGAIEFKDLPIELWEVKKYEQEMILFNQLKASQTSESIKTVSSDKTIEEVSKQVKEWTVDDHFKAGYEKSKEIFDALIERVIEIDNNIKVNPQRYYISLKLNKNFAFIIPRKDKILIILLLEYKESSKLSKFTVKKLSKGVQGFYNGPSFGVEVDSKNFREVIDAIELAYKKSK